MTCTYLLCLLTRLGLHHHLAQVPYVMMHMRGDPSTMMRKEHVRYEDVCQEVGSTLRHQVRTPGGSIG